MKVRICKEVFLTSLMVFCCLLFCFLLLGCESASYLKSELTGTNSLSADKRYSQGQAPVVSATKKYPVSTSRLRSATLEVLDEKGYIYTENPSTSTIKTEPQLITDTSKLQIFGAYYYAKLFIKISNSEITYRAKFDKKSNVTMPEQNVEYPSKENELRGEFFRELDQKLGINSTAVNNRGISKTTIFNVQKRLSEIGYQPGPIDGLMGLKTKNAILQYQKDNNLNATGNLDNETLNELGLH